MFYNNTNFRNAIKNSRPLIPENCEADCNLKDSFLYNQIEMLLDFHRLSYFTRNSNKTDCLKFKCLLKL